MGFLVGTAAVVAATVLRWALDPVLGDTLPYITYFLAIVVAAWYGRLWSGVFATVLSVVVVNWYFIAPRQAFALDNQTQDLVATAVFLLVGLALAGFSEALHRSRVEAQARARESDAATASAQTQREVLRVTIASIGDAVITTDEEARITYMNAVAEDLVGWSGEEGAGRSLEEVFQIVDEGTREPVENPCRRALDAGRVVGLANHTILISRDGTERPIDDSASPIQDEEGRTFGAVLIFRDATEQRRIHEDLERLASIVADSDDAIIGKRLDGTITSWNAAAERLYGLGAEEAVGSPISLIVPEDRMEELSTIMDRLGRGEAVDRLETIRIRKDGSPVDVSLTISPIKDRYGRFIGASAIARDIGEQKRAYEALRRREQELADFFEGSVVGLHRVDRDGTILEANRAELDMLGYDREEYVGRSIADFHEDEDVIEDILDQLHRGDPVRNQEARVRCKDGTIKHVLIDSNVYREEGQFVHSRCFTRDVTAEKTAMEALRVSEERLRLAMSSGSIGVWDWEIASGRLRWTDHVYRIHGVSEEAFHGAIEDFQKLVHPDDATRVAEAIDRALDHDAQYDIEYRIVRPSGEVRWVHASAEVIRESSGLPVRVVGATVDTTERRSAEDNARFLADATDAITTLGDLDSATQRLAGVCVPFFADWCTIHLTEASGESRLVAAAHADPDKEPLLTRLDGGYPLSWSPAPPSDPKDGNGMGGHVLEAPMGFIESVAGDDEQLEILRRLQPRSWITAPLESRGKRVGCIAFMRSDSSQRYSEAEVELALELVDRTATSVDNCMLYEKLLKEDRQKDNFLGMLAHELRNPLAAIQYSVELSKTLPDRAAWANETIRRQVEHLARLVDDLLDVSRITRNVIRLQKETMDVNDVVKRAVATARPLIDEQEHRLALRMPSSELPVSADPTRIEQVVVNLLTNAAKYTPKGGQLQLSAFAEGDQAVIQMQDSGIGIAPELLPNVFGLFTQGESELARPQGGLGIGLTVVHHLVELHGGTVSAASEGVGRGSEFTVRLPLLEGARVAESSYEAPTVRQGLRVLVVEDNQDTAQSVGMLLDSAGCTTRIVYDGMAALEMSESFRPDVVLLDIGLPGLDGYEVAARLRRDPELEGVKLVAISGYGQGGDRKRSEDAGFDRHLVKPIDFETLLKELDDFVKDAR